MILKIEYSTGNGFSTVIPNIKNAFKVILDNGSVFEISAGDFDGLNIVKKSGVYIHDRSENKLSIH